MNTIGKLFCTIIGFGISAAQLYTSAHASLDLQNNSYSSPHKGPSSGSFVDPLGIKITSQTLHKSFNFLSIGSDDSSLTWDYIYDNPEFYGHITVANFSNNRVAVGVSIGEITSAFLNNNSSIFNNIDGTSDTLTKDSVYWIYTKSSGIVYKFLVSTNKLDSISFPNGKKISIGYRADQAGYYGFNYIVSTDGYGLKFFINPDNSTSISIVNEAINYCDAALNCDGYARTINIKNVTQSDSPTGSVDEITDVIGNKWQFGAGETYEYDSTPLMFKTQVSLQYFRTPLGSTTKIEYDTYGGIKKFTDIRGSFLFEINPSCLSPKGTYMTCKDYYTLYPGATRDVTVKSPDGNILYRAVYDLNGKVELVQDALGASLNKSTSFLSTSYPTKVDGFVISSYSRLNQSLLPDGLRTAFTIDSRGNEIARSVTPRTGFYEPILSFGASFDTVCTNLRTCDQPNSTTDTLGNITSYTYDPAHGGILTKTLPADVNGVRAQTRFSYQSLYPKIKNSAGVLVNAPNPIVKLSRTSYCITATTADPASCVGTAQERITEFEYYSSNLLKTAVVEKLGDGTVLSRVDFTYDDIGNVTSVDGPRTDVDDKIYTTYDLLRRKIFEIGADPDGTGALKRSIVKHTYDADGNEILTQIGTGNAIDGSDFIVLSFKRMTYDAAGQLIKTEVGQP